MTHVALTAKYRPQTFAQVAGQETVKAILSRAALEGRVAPAYLLSGTRGVGKTTLARIFAKALNCRTAPTAEPCNECDQCRAVTAGSAVDVVEIDGASNRGIDDVRRLREVVGYAPMEGGYKIFIIDEAHMLSREAFNALLKTLEEPPARVTFIMATTEPHKFPATIISRCQHYVFKRLPESGLSAHLADVLHKEGVAFDDSAVRLIARRGAGSVRDSMSLLAQVLALGEGRISEEAARGVLGLAGQEVFLRMLEAFKSGDSLGLAAMLRELLDQGLDMGFFLRELSSLWRNLFMLRQSGESALAVVDLPENEARQLLDLGRGFSLQHIHACWQMTLEGQRRVLTSLEPALALELLLLNLAMLPRLLSLEALSSMGRKAGPGTATPPAQGDSGTPAGQGGPPQGGGGARTARPEPPESPAPPAPPVPPVPEVSDFRSAPAVPVAEHAPSGQAGPESRGPSEDGQATEIIDDEPVLSFAAGSEDESGPDEAAVQQAMDENFLARNAPGMGNGQASAGVAGARERSEDAAAGGFSADTALAPWPRWPELIDQCEQRELPSWFAPLLRRVNVAGGDRSLEITPLDAFTAERLREPDVLEILRSLLAEYCGQVPELRFNKPSRKHKSPEELKNEVLSHPLVKEMQERFGARYLDSGRIR